ncbi:hypothetical protein [Polymorphospora rubra]|uniref:Uncharacterized protein n=1 Tax=Polymorphospora rubra TaxID=338584 RepID=A0A810N501_9ACTN|nr:hypothetical protein [Polymorphospora rubra]BCJ68020.1 hypothetical protein Prubr_50410 [Polymorphospora rubra]
MLEGIDDNSLDEIARIACGGDDYPVYRRAAELPKLLQHAGWENIPPYNGEQRRSWLTDQLRRRRDTPGPLTRSSAALPIGASTSIATSL